MDAPTTLRNIFFILLLTACGKPGQSAEDLIPSQSETCSGTADQKKYIVRYKDGRWGHFNFQDREDFKNEVVIPQLEEIEFIEYDQKISANEFTPELSAKDNPENQSTIGQRWNAEYNWGLRSLNVTAAWKKNVYGEGVTVAVIDSGVDVNHRLLRSQILVNAGESGLDNSGKSKANNGVDDDENGYIDDVYGYDFSSNSNNLTDEVQHGTHVAGIIAAAHNDSTVSSTYIQGVAPKAKILPIKFLTPDGGYLSDAMKAIDYAVLRGAKIINASWGGTGCSLSLRQKVSDLSNLNVLFVSAAGNSGRNLDRYPEYPAAFNVGIQITVGSITPNFLPASHSNYSLDLVHIFAPGVEIISTITNNGEAPYEGTSMATPFISGVAALLLSNAPHESLYEVRSKILQSVQVDQLFLNQTRGRIVLKDTSF
jgi:subtilisin family serine protease